MAYLVVILLAIGEHVRLTGVERHIQMWATGDITVVKLTSQSTFVFFNVPSAIKQNQTPGLSRVNI